MKTMVDNAKIARMEKNIKETDAKVKNIKSVPPSTTADAGKVLTVNEDGSISWQQKGAGGGMKAFFDAGGKCSKSTVTSFDGIIPFTATSDVTDMSFMFSSCSNLTSVPSLDTSKVTDMRHMFSDCSVLESIPLFNTSKVTSFEAMFSSCAKLKTIPSFNTSSAKNMKDMFIYCHEITSIPLLDTSKVFTTSYMFYSCLNLTSVPALDLSNDINMGNMFGGCAKLAEIHIKNIGTDLDISASTKFTREALLEIIGNLKTVTSTKTLTMGSTNLAKLTDEDKAIATNKGWTLA